MFDIIATKFHSFFYLQKYKFIFKITRKKRYFFCLIIILEHRNTYDKDRK